MIDEIDITENINKKKSIALLFYKIIQYFISFLSVVSELIGIIETNLNNSIFMEYLLRFIALHRKIATIKRIFVMQSV